MLETAQAIGVTVSLWHYPIKSMLGEELNATTIVGGSLLGDRSYALIDTETGKVVSAKNPRKWPHLFDFRATFVEPLQVGGELPPVRVTLPDGTTVTTTQRDFNQRMSSPLVRRDVPELVGQLKRIEGLRSVSITTNGILLKQQAKALAEAGLSRINVSLDSLIREKFTQLTRRDQMDQVLEGLEEVEQYPSVHPVKINAVAIRNFSEAEVLAFVRFARRKAYIMRWIEFMPLDADQLWRKEDILTGGEIQAIIEAEYGPLVKVERDPSETARRYTFSDGIGEVGFINPVSEPFCATCDRIRLTADGQLRTCLFATTETDLRVVLRSGGDDEAIATTLRRAVWHKELKHYIGDKRFKRASRSMSMIGG